MFSFINHCRYTNTCIYYILCLHLICIKCSKQYASIVCNKRKLPHIYSVHVLYFVRDIKINKERAIFVFSK